MRGICIRCKKRGRMDRHHLIPEWCGGTNEDVVLVCRSCHKLYETMFDRFFKYNTFDMTEVYRKRSNSSARQYYKENRDKALAYKREYVKRDYVKKRNVENSRKYHKAHREKYKEYFHNYYITHRKNY